MKWEDVAACRHVIVARATCGAGVLRMAEENGSFPQGATGYHRARIIVFPTTS